MDEPVRIGIVICDRYRRCAGGKCFRALRERVGAFDAYAGREVELVGFTTCDGCPGGNVEYLGEEMVKNGAEVIHLATGLVVGYPPCPHIKAFRDYLEKRHGVRVVVGTHPIPKKYVDMHEQLGTWKGEGWAEIIAPSMSEAAIRAQYD